MKKLFVLIFAVTSMVVAKDAVAQNRAKLVNCTVSVKDPKCQMPPHWLLNKVTPAQYDTLVVLNRLCTVDYSMLKGYNVTSADVAQVMKTAREYINKALANTNGVTPNVGWKVTSIKQLRPWCDKIEKNVRKVEYMVYSSIDGYDVHLLLRTTLLRDRKTGGYRSVAYQLVPYSVQNIPVTVDAPSVCFKGKPVTNLEIGKDGKSASYTINATVIFTDPLGEKHQELVSTTVTLEL